VEVRGNPTFSLVTLPAIWWRSVELQNGSVTFAADDLEFLTLMKHRVR
jgi:hypothetical protein